MKLIFGSSVSLNSATKLRVGTVVLLWTFGKIVWIATQVRSIRLEKRLNEVVNRLNKTKDDKGKVDLRAEREDRDRLEREDQKSTAREQKKREKEEAERKAKEAEQRWVKNYFIHQVGPVGSFDDRQADKTITSCALWCAIFFFFFYCQSSVRVMILCKIILHLFPEVTQIYSKQKTWPQIRYVSKSNFSLFSLVVDWRSL